MEYRSSTDSAVLNQRKGRFRPNRLTFEQGVARVDAVTRPHISQLTSRITTSKDALAVTLMDDLRTDNVPEGFEKTQLPFVLEGAQLFMSRAAPNSSVPLHAHDGDGIRFIVAGSVQFGEQELSSGDWMFIPKGVPYSLAIGPEGALMAYCYSCCCA